MPMKESYSTPNACYMISHTRSQGFLKDLTIAELAFWPKKAAHRTLPYVDERNTQWGVEGQVSKKKGGGAIKGKIYLEKNYK